MPATFGTGVAIQFVQKVMQVFYATSFFDDVTNRDYYTVGNSNPDTTQDIKAKGQKFRIPTLYSNGWTSYNGSDITFADVTEVLSDLTIDQTYSLSDLVKDFSLFKSQVKNPKSSLIQQAGLALKKIMDKYVLGLYTKSGSGNWIGTDYAAGTVAVTTGTGAVTGTGTTFTAAMVGRPFRAAGHSKWYRVKTYTSATAIVIENDSDDETSAYDGGTISAGAAYTIQAVTKLSITKSNIAQYLAYNRKALTNNAIPDDGSRFQMLPADAEPALLGAAENNLAIKEVQDATVAKGKVKKMYGFDIYVVPNDYVSGDNTNGYYCLFGHTSAITAGSGFISPIKVIEPEKNFGEAIKGLFAFGAKVADERRKALGVMFASFA